jgi:hypothetical protein
MPAKAVLRRVTHRKPVPFLLHPERESEDRADFLGVYVVETLECSHTVTTYPEADPLIAKYRRCNKCDGGSVISISTRKGPSSVDGSLGDERKRAWAA